MKQCRDFFSEVQIQFGHIHEEITSYNPKMTTTRPWYINMR